MKKVFLVLLMLTVCITAVSADGWVIRTSDIVSILKNLDCTNIETYEGGFVRAESADGYTLVVYEGDDVYICSSFWTANINASDANYWNSEVFYPAMYIDEDGEIVVQIFVVKEGLTKENLSASIKIFLDLMQPVADYLYN